MKPRGVETTWLGVIPDTSRITDGESGRSGVGRTRNLAAPTSLAGQFEQPYGPMGPPTLFTILLLHYTLFPSPPRKRGSRGDG